MEMKDYQRKLFPYAYNILGSYDDANDAIQDVIAKYHLSDKGGIENESNYLIKGVINQSINIKKRKSRTLNPKLTLPEPLSTENADTNIDLKDILSYSLLVLLDFLNPKERAVFILKEAFDYSHDEIAGSLQISIDSSRKILSRAKAKLGELETHRKNRKIPNNQLELYITAIQNGNVKCLEGMLSKDISVMTDGGKISIVAEHISGVENTIRLMSYVHKEYQSDAVIKTTSVNHLPALLFYNNGILTNCQIFSVDPKAGIITSIYSIVDPGKLKKLI